MEDFNKNKKREREPSSSDESMGNGNTKPKRTIDDYFKKEASSNGQPQNPFRRATSQRFSGAAQGPSSSNTAKKPFRPVKKTVKQTDAGRSDLICGICKMTFETPDELWTHDLRVAHGYDGGGQMVAVPPGFGIDENCRIIAPPQGFYIERDTFLVKQSPTMPTARSRPAGPPAFNPPPIFEPGCPAAGTFLPVGTIGTPVYHSSRVWMCPWSDCSHKNWKIWRVNRHINNVHVKPARKYVLCTCGLIFEKRGEEEAHRAATGHDKCS